MFTYNHACLKSSFTIGVFFALPLHVGNHSGSKSCLIVATFDALR
ncbi:hypothetical protein ACLKMH_19395 [Psychromonas sp. KJ10-10]